MYKEGQIYKINSKYHNGVYQVTKVTYNYVDRVYPQLPLSTLISYEPIYSLFDNLLRVKKKDREFHLTSDFDKNSQLIKDI